MGSEILIMSLHMMLPLITIFQLVGVSCMVCLPLTTQKMYITYVIPFYEKHETLITDTVNDNIMNRKFKQMIDYMMKIRGPEMQSK